MAPPALAHDEMLDLVAAATKVGYLGTQLMNDPESKAIARNMKRSLHVLAGHATHMKRIHAEPLTQEAAEAKVSEIQFMAQRVATEAGATVLAFADGDDIAYQFEKFMDCMDELRAKWENIGPCMEACWQSQQ